MTEKSTPPEIDWNTADYSTFTARQALLRAKSRSTTPLVGADMYPERAVVLLKSLEHGTIGFFYPGEIASLQLK